MNYLYIIGDWILGTNTKADKDRNRNAESQTWFEKRNNKKN